MDPRHNFLIIMPSFFLFIHHSGHASWPRLILVNKTWDIVLAFIIIIYSVKSSRTDDIIHTSKSVPASTRLEDRPKKGTKRTAKSAPINPCPSRGALFNRFFGKPAHGPPHVAGGASGPIGGCQDESRTDNPDLDLRHVFDRNNRKTDLI